MKKSLFVLAALTAFAGVASAQSSVTLFGVVDLSARSVKNGTASIKSLSKDGNASSRLGFRGVEDLGGGMRAGFWIEGALNPDDGTGTATGGGQNWQRRSTLSLMGGFGELRLGRDYTPTFWNHTVFDPFGTNGIGSQTNLMTPYAVGSVQGNGAGTLVRANNTIGYFLPAMGGVYGQVQLAAAEGQPNGNKYFGLRVGYAAGPVNVAVALGNTEVTATRDQKALNIGGSFNAGFMTVMAQYHVYTIDNSTGADPKQKNALIGVTAPLGAGTLKASFGKVGGTAGYSAKQIAAGYVHDLSKRTAAYAHVSKITNDAGSRFSVAGPGAGGSPAFGLTTGNNKPGSTGYEFGVRHSF
jgi:predicted porin